MKAVQLIGYGDVVKNLELRDVPEPPPPGKEEVLVGMEYAPINFNDLMVPWRVFPWKPSLPATIGNEGEGIVLALGEGGKPVAVGDRVVLPPFQRPSQGADSPEHFAKWESRIRRASPGA
jgi:NADPH:quinone reductase-like Zn-dependent oxidoreductase